MAARRANNKNESSKSEEQKPAETALKKAAPKKEEKKGFPDLMYVKSNHHTGAMLGGQVSKFEAGQEINDKHLMYQMGQRGIELVESFEECDLIFLNRD